MTNIRRASDKRMRDQITRAVTWPTLQTSVGETQRAKIETGDQMIVFNEFTTDGELVIDGEMVLI